MSNPIGVISTLRPDASNLDEVASFGLDICQLVSWDEDLWTDVLSELVRKKAADLGMTITSFWAGWGGPKTWDFIEGPTTLGVVPEEYRADRVETLKHAADFAKKMDVPAIVTHLGFIPENAGDPVFHDVVAAVKDIAECCAGLGLEFWFETGQETPVTVLRLIEVVGTGNLGINLDPANLVMYGKGNPIDSLDVFGKYVRSIHAKDGKYPTEPMHLGPEVKVGEGKVRFPEFVKALTDIGFDGAYIIEREISGDQQSKDIADTIEYLKGLLK